MAQSASLRALSKQGWKAMVDSIGYKLLKDEAKRAAKARG